MTGVETNQHRDASQVGECDVQRVLRWLTLRANLARLWRPVVWSNDSLGGTAKSLSGRDDRANHWISSKGDSPRPCGRASHAPARNLEIGEEFLLKSVTLNPCLSPACIQTQDESSASSWSLCPRPRQVPGPPASAVARESLK